MTAVFHHRSLVSLIRIGLPPSGTATYPPRGRTSGRASRSGEDEGRVLEQVHQYGEPAGRQNPVDRAVVDREGQPEHDPWYDDTVLDHRLVAHGTHREDGRLRRVDDRGELLDAVHPEVGHRDRPALEVVLPEG